MAECYQAGQFKTKIQSQSMKLLLARPVALSKGLLMSSVGLRSMFYSNRNLMSMSKIMFKLKNYFNQTSELNSGTLRILQSSFSPFHRRGFSSSFVYQVYKYKMPYKKSNTWRQYNKYYGNSHWDKLKGPALFTIAFCVGTTFLSPFVINYTPLAVCKSNPSILIYTIIAANAVVLGMWRAPGFLKFLTRYGLLVKDKVYSNWSLLGAAFSHQSVGHFFVNMFVLHSFGTTLCAMLGPAGFLSFYLNSAVIASFVSIVIPTLTRTGLSVGSLGASGAVFSVVGAFSYLIPKAPILLFFIPIPGGAWFAFLGCVAYNVAGLFFRWGAYDYAAHLGGSFAGVLYGWYVSRRMKEARARRMRQLY